MFPTSPSNPPIMHLFSCGKRELDAHTASPKARAHADYRLASDLQLPSLDASRADRERQEKKIAHSPSLKHGVSKSTDYRQNSFVTESEKGFSAVAVVHRCVCVFPLLKTMDIKLHTTIKKPPLIFSPTPWLSYSNNSIASRMTLGAKKPVPDSPLTQAMRIVFAPSTRVPAGIA